MKVLHNAPYTDELKSVVSGREYIIDGNRDRDLRRRDDDHRRIQEEPLKRQK